MGRVFEKRKYTMFARFAKMAKTFTKIGKDIAIAVKAGGPDPDTNPRLRMCIQNARAVNMPKTNVEAAIKRASDKDTANYEEAIYEGYAPHGVPVLVECTTDNPTRTVANIRMYFTRNGGSLGTKGSVAFMFDRKALFKISSEGLNKEETEFELIDFGAEEFTWDDEHKELIIQTPFTEFGHMQKALEDKKIEIKESSKTFIPTTHKELTDAEELDVQAMIDKMDEDDDVIAVYHNAK
ncbi:MAG TPA: YebC/PmpR family DNA-binding transcriptional regulator [Bacteroidia bacterium]|jgi:YebC/PmpR family DNA-binding regulatory protein|nr:YebC/PmpR family DNA-binding transcriptional regulator [Bacteroidia bacterium]